MTIQAFIPSAGLGTRLRPLTDTRPKALVEVGGTTLLERAIRRMESIGAKRIVVNVHHFADQIIEFVGARIWQSDIKISDEREMLADTGGGIKHASKLFLEGLPIMVHNVDVLSTINLKDMVVKHEEDGNLVTLAVSRRDTSRQLVFDQNYRLAGWHDKKNDRYLWSRRPAEKYTELAFSGISMLSPQLPEMLPPDSTPYPIIPEYVRLAGEKEIGAFLHSPDDWIDIGKTETIQKLNQKGYEKFLA